MTIDVLVGDVLVTISGCGDLALRLLGLELDDTARLLDGDDTRPPAFALPGDLARYAPDRPVDVRHVDLAVRLDFAAKRVLGEVTTHFAVLYERVRTISLDAAELEVKRVTLAGAETELAFWSEGEKLHIRLDRDYAYGEEFAAQVRYSTRPRAGLVFVEPSAGDPKLPVQAWTQGETEYHHYWFPCHDFPNDRATTTLSATVPAEFFAFSNGLLAETREHHDGTKTYVWRMDVAFPAYLVTLVVGQFAELPATWRDITCNAYVPMGREEDGRRMFAKAPAMLEYYSERFGVAYPYPKYGQIVAQMFTGAMENASATTHSYRLLADERASLDYTPEPVVAHEMVHQWHGDLLAVRDWSHTWLKEGFADYFEASWREHDRGLDEYRVELRDYLQAYLEADKRGRRPIVYNVYRKNGNELFDRHVYEKAACVLHMLRFELGEEPFWRAIQHYTRRNQGREVITADLERAVEEVTGRSMARFFEQWLYKAGHPEFQVSYAWDDAQRLATLTVRQKQATSEQTPVFMTPVEIGFLVPESDAARADDPHAQAELVTFRVTIERADQTFSFPLARRPFSVRFDQGGWLLKTLDFARSSELLRYQLRHDPDVLGRIEAAEALGKLADEQSVAALESVLLDESFWAVRGAIAAALGQQRSERALDALLGALRVVREPKARRGIAAALGAFRAPEQVALAERAAEALTDLLRRGEPSYYVEAAGATALGKTRAPGAFETLVSLVERPSWNELIRAGVFAGLGELGDPRSVDVLAVWAADRAKPMDARVGALVGLRLLAATGRVEGEAKVRAVDAALAGLSDPWELAVLAAAGALRAWGDARAIHALERVVSSNPDERIVRAARESSLALRRGATRSAEARQLRGDLDALREENRTLRTRLDALESRLNGQRDEKAERKTAPRRASSRPSRRSTPENGVPTATAARG
jgi:aminopeptidase N